MMLHKPVFDISRSLSRKVLKRFNSLEGTKMTSDFKSRNLTTAAIIVIGDEVLKGQVADTNSHFISKKLYSLNVKLKKIVVIGDDIDDICNEVRSMSRQVSHVITTGGIGPTHDDITFDAVAKAFEETTYPHPCLVSIVKDYFKTDDLKSAAMKLAHVPKSAKLTFSYDEARGRHSLFPLITVHNVHILPGVPELMEKMFTISMQEMFGGGGTKLHTRELYLTTTEVHLAEKLNEVVSRFPEVKMGSYPKLFHSYYKVLITLESEKENSVEEAYRSLRSALIKDVVNFDKYPLDDPYQKIETLVPKLSHLRKSLDLVVATCKKYGPDEMCLYTDGSKASTVVLHIVYACVRKLTSSALVKAVYVQGSKEDPKLMEYIQDMVRRYDVKMKILHGPLHETLVAFLQDNKFKVLMTGTVDGGDSQLSKKHLDGLAESVDVINVTGEWSDPEIWNFIRSLSLPYCSLYDKGYSSVRSLERTAEENHHPTGPENAASSSGKSSRESKDQSAQTVPEE